MKRGKELSHGEFHMFISEISKERGDKEVVQLECCTKVSKLVA